MSKGQEIVRTGMAVTEEQQNSSQFVSCGFGTPIAVTKHNGLCILMIISAVRKFKRNRADLQVFLPSYVCIQYKEDSGGSDHDNKFR